MTTPAANHLPQHSWMMHLFLTLVIALAFVGFFVGLRQGKTPHVVASVAHTTATSARNAIPSVNWPDFDRQQHGPNSNWSSSLAAIEQPQPDLFAPVTWTPEQRAFLLQLRAQRRAYDGAPPVVPHPIDQLSSSSCVACHAHGLVIAGNVQAPQMSHMMLANCTQCHVEQSSAHFESFPFADSAFIGLEAPTLGSRAWHGAPPTIPHATTMRENCMACHGPTAPQPIRSTHPWRTNCMQCHTPSAVLDQSASRGVAEFLAPPTVLSP